MKARRVRADDSSLSGESPELLEYEPVDEPVVGMRGLVRPAPVYSLTSTHAAPAALTRSWSRIGNTVVGVPPAAQTTS